ncbi:MAG: aspartate aminotransferase family protein [Myxococcales bacterium]|nr:aspartate aminotransferase family protein [Myxococcota bacterium]MDW8282096.1 aspartate aminotransferase family protein [Myxococcales bacterium]
MSSLPCPSTADLLRLGAEYLTPNYRQQPVVLVRGLGCEVWDTEGRRYLDLTGGIAACPLGHSHPRLVRTLADQAARLIHVSNLFFNEPQLLLARRLCESLQQALGPCQAFFCNSGAEANEAAIKLARRYHQTLRADARRIEVLSFEGSFHGRTVATVALTGQEKYRAGFGPLVGWARHLPWPEREGDLRPLEHITDQTCAVLIEPIQAEGGIRVPPPGFLRALRRRCDETGALLIFDEVQTGIGRTGTLWGHQSDPQPAAPDILTVAKGLGGGVPVGAMLARQEVARALTPGSHASTFGGNPLATAAALTVLDTLEDEGLLENTRQRGEELTAGLRQLCQRHAPLAIEPRGRGLLQGLLLAGDAMPAVHACRERGVLLSVAGGTVVRFAPPLVVSAAQIAEGLQVLDEVLASLQANGAKA